VAGKAGIVGYDKNGYDENGNKDIIGIGGG